MRKVNWKWSGGAVLVTGLLLAGAAVAAEHVLAVRGYIQNINCGTTGAANFYYYAEGLGYDANNVKVCEVSARLGPNANTTSGICTGPLGLLAPPATSHTSRIVIRNGETMGIVQQVVPASTTRQTSWTGASTPIQYTIPAHGSCAANLLTSYSYGKDLP